MGLDPEFIDAHIRHWQQELNNEYYPHKRKWPSRIFRHDPLENIGQVLNTGSLLSRTGSNGVRPVEGAALDIVNSRDNAHNFVRFYFRPQTPTQFHIAGIRKPEEYYQNAHIPMLGMMTFDARRILALDDVQFSNCNMQSGHAEVGSTEEFFREQINFSKVYHTGGIANDRSIIAIRCAEVLLSSPLAIAEVIQHIICRSNAEKKTLLAMLNPDALRRFEDKVIVSDDMKVFKRDYTYVEEVALSDRGITIQLSPRFDRQNIKISISVTALPVGTEIINFTRNSFEARPPENKAWIINGRIEDGQYAVEIRLEDCLAYKANLSFTELPF